MPDFAQVYSFIGSVFDPNSTNHLQKLRQMDPINVETVLLLMRNLSVNLMSPEFEGHKRLLSSYDTNSDKSKFVNICSESLTNKSESAILYGLVFCVYLLKMAVLGMQDNEVLLGHFWRLYCTVWT
ncbi:unnamed protein product [Sphenostylis stenocarpa]|uniref:Uncharacterized protein n=1 Tax=Sphenostylis stenocarpa TaxID=92480 RepID=A0AA86VN04_9FABA|nr:unnamed protein product [Sphenostylis stenocarpa]